MAKRRKPLTAAEKHQALVKRLAAQSVARHKQGRLSKIDALRKYGEK